MPRSSAQSDFVVKPREPEPEPVVELPEGADAVQLPRAVLKSTEASARATRLVMTITFVVLAALVILTLVGPHIPSGE
ncbi:MAG TPA: hypothetical protein VFQ53_18715 [Kofleriaceae bacterium]|nr:hypothetical protein [Kofleriaceae bacterium]